jgi:predicted Fe-Mo cluster-binding NifX family protein
MWRIIMLAIPLKALDSTDTRTSKLFGKAPYVLLVSPDGSAGVLQNEFTSGRELAAELIRRGVKTIITNHLGQKAYELLSSYDISILYNSEESSVLLSLDAYKAGALKAFDASHVQVSKHRNESNCDHGEHEGGGCGHDHTHENGQKCCEKEGASKQKGKGRCCQNR